MKNVHLIPTSQPSRLFYGAGAKKLMLSSTAVSFKIFERSPQHIYITSDKQIKEGDWFIYRGYEVCKCTGLSQSKQILTDNQIAKHKDYGKPQSLSKKIILTTDQNLIKNGVQAIDDEFLEWFVKNPSCEWVEVVFNNRGITGTEKILKTFGEYKIIIPKEEPNPFELPKALPDDVFYESLEPKQETTDEELLEALKSFRTAPLVFVPNERMYSEEDLREAFKQSRQAEIFEKNMPPVYESFEEWLEEFKKK